jgi:outer membrane lipoprotein SlyB
LDEAVTRNVLLAREISPKEHNMIWSKVKVGGIGAILATIVFGATAGFSEDAAMPRVRGTIDQVNGNTLTIKTRSGSPTTVQLKDNAPVVAVTKGSMSDIQMNSFVGIAAMPQPDGTIKAVEVSVFAEPLRGTAEGHYPWDLMPGSSMTNAAVTQQVTKQEGNTLTLKYKDGEKTIVVPSDAIVVNLIPGDKADLKPGAKIFVPAWAKNANGTMEAAVALVGRDGITPPM